MVGNRQAGARLTVLMLLALVLRARAQPPSVVVVRHPEPTWSIKLELPKPPGPIRGLERFAPHNYWERRSIQVQLTRLLTMVGRRWVPDTTSFQVIFYKLNLFPREQQHRALLYAFAGAVALRGRGWMNRFFRRHKVPLIEPAAQGVRSKPLSWSNLLRAWYEIRVNRYSYTYFQLPRYRATFYSARSPTYWSWGLWWGFMHRFSLSLQRAGGRSWKSATLALSRYGQDSWLIAHVERISTHWRSWWQVSFRWEWARMP